MSTADLGTFACDACGKNYKWKPEFTGRKIKCKCGHVMAPIEPLRPEAAPVPPPSAQDNGGLPDLDSLYDLSPDAATLARAEAGAQAGADDGGYDIAGAGDNGSAVQCPSCGSHLQPGQALCLDCGYNLKTGSRLKTQLLRDTPYVPTKRSLRDEEEASTPTDLEARLGLSLKKDIYLPIALIVAGTILAFVNAMGMLELPFGYAAIWVGFWTVLGTIFTFVGVLITAKLMSLGLGHPLQVLLKVAAVALLPAAINDIIANSAPLDPSIGFIGWVGALVVTYILFMVLFGMDFGESIFCSTVIWILTTWVLALVLRLLLAGAIGLSAGGGGFIGGDDEDEDDPAFVVPDSPAKKPKKPVTKPADAEAAEDQPDAQNKDPNDPNPEEDGDDSCRTTPPCLVPMVIT